MIPTLRLRPPRMLCAFPPSLFDSARCSSFGPLSSSLSPVQAPRIRARIWIIRYVNPLLCLCDRVQAGPRALWSSPRAEELFEKAQVAAAIPPALLRSAGRHRARRVRRYEVSVLLGRSVPCRALLAAARSAHHEVSRCFKSGAVVSRCTNRAALCSGHLVRMPFSTICSSGARPAPEPCSRGAARRYSVKLQVAFPEHALSIPSLTLTVRQGLGVDMDDLKCNSLRCRKSLGLEVRALVARLPSAPSAAVALTLGRFAPTGLVSVVIRLRKA